MVNAFEKLMKINEKLSYIYDDIISLLNNTNESDFESSITHDGLISMKKCIQSFDKIVDNEIFWRG